MTHIQKHTELQSIITQAFENRDALKPNAIPQELKDAIKTTMGLLQTGELRVATPRADLLGQSDHSNRSDWEVHAWVKEAVLLAFRCYDNTLFSGEISQFYDKIPLQYANFTQSDFQAARVRVVPPATVREGCYIGPNTVLMPSYVNIGAYVGEGTMVDIWATIGSCAQIGQNVHISAGVGIGGVLEPIQATPTIIEDNCFIGAGCQVVEGVIVEHGSVLSTGCNISQSTRIYDRENNEILYGRIPSGSVVVPGSLPSKNGKYHLSCVVIAKRVDEKTLKKVGINNLLREHL